MLKKFAVIALVLLLCSCSKSFDGDDDLKAYRGMSEQQLFEAAKKYLASKDYDGAIKRIEAMDTLYPFSRYSKQAHIDLIYAYFNNEDYVQASATADRFIHLYPRDKDVDYAYYMRGVANFEQKRGTFAKILRMDVAWRDPGTQWQSYKDFLQLVKRYPNSRYYKDSVKRLTYLRNQFAKRELNIAEFYMNRKLYVAALNRANYVIRHYGQSPQAKKALVITQKINKTLNLKQGEVDAAKVFHESYS
jgi:outer membrane protein assembly factor BamD